MVRSGDRTELRAGSPLRRVLHIGAVTTQSVRRTLEAPAQVEAVPARVAHVTPPLTGRVVSIAIQFGDTVAAGDPLFTLDSPDLVAAQTDYLRARSALAQAERVLTRQRDLAAHGIGAQREVEQAQTERELAQSELERARLRLQLLHIDPGALGRPLTVRSPIAGRVVALSVAPGEYHDVSDELLTVADLSSVWVTADVQEKDVRRVHTGEEATARLAAYPGEDMSGRVLFVGDLLDPETRTIKVRIAFSNEAGRLRPGMFASVRFTETAAPEIVIPSAAIVLLGDTNYVFVEVGPWVLQKRRVVPGAQVGANATAISEGLREGERIVIDNAVLLQ